MVLASSNSPENVSAELAEVLFRTSLVNSYRDKDFDLSFGSTLLGFVASRTRMASWMRQYVESNTINLADIMATRNIDETILTTIAGREYDGRPRSWRQTTSVRELFEHASAFLERVGGDELDERHLLAAYIYQPGSHKEQLKTWRFDRIHWSNSFLAELSLEHTDELESWKKIHVEAFGTEADLRSPTSRAMDQSVASPPSEVDTPPPDAPKFLLKDQQDQTQIVMDGPAIQDLLGRTYLAEALGQRINKTWIRYRDDKIKGSFMLHIHGAWGSGKSSLLNFLKVELQPRAEEQRNSPLNHPIDNTWLDWIVVDFNAWQRQHIEPPWWSLIDTIYTQACAQLKNSYNEPKHARKLKLRERWWRFTTGRRDHLIAVLISFLFLGGVVVWRQFDTNLIGDLLKSAATIVGLAGGLWSTILLLSRSLLSGSSQSAQAFMQRSGDPMERVSKHFVELLEWIKKPVVIFIDDLDRCQSSYVVTLLEGIQTLFNNPHAVYVIAADRRWLHVSFEKLYEPFAAQVREPGRRLGSLFLEKAFEVSISVPRMAPERRKIYWGSNLGKESQPVESQIKSISLEVQDEFKNDKTEAEVLKRLGSDNGDPLRFEVRKGAALRQLAKQEVAKTTDFFLEPFGDLAEPNPRAMKRLVNAYTLLRDIAILGESRLLFDLKRRRQLALWAIVSLRWPLLKEYIEDYLEQDSEDSADIIKMICEQGDIPKINGDIDALVKSREVIKVFNGTGIGTKLDKETICSLVGISAAQPKSGGVA